MADASGGVMEDAPRSAVLDDPAPSPTGLDFDSYQPEILDKEPEPLVATEPPSVPVEEPRVEEPPVEEPPVEEPPPPVAAAPRKPLAVVTDATGAVRAAGGVVWTDWGEAGLRVVVVHRPKYDDWSLPKGKAEPGETDPACAVREVREETGLACSLGAELPSSTYLDRFGRPKTVRYWAMQPLGGTMGAQHEVDELRWLPVEEAKHLLSYDRDRAVVDALVAHLRGDAPDEPQSVEDGPFL